MSAPDAPGRSEDGPLNQSRLRAYGFGLAALYGWFFVTVYRNQVWIMDKTGAAVSPDFSSIWVVGIESMRGHLAAAYDSGTFLRMQAALLGVSDGYYPNWPYPPTFSLILVPLGWLPYRAAFLAWAILTLIALAAVIYAAIPRAAAVALLLASPFTAWNFLAGQNGALTGALLGGALLALEERPLLAGFFMGCMTYKPQYGLLLPLALAVSGRWRAFLAATAAALGLAALSAACFGLDAWIALPHGLATQFGVVLQANGASDEHSDWGRLQSIYGLTRLLYGGPTLAWAAQGAVILSVAGIVVRVWRSEASQDLKSATLAAAAIAATPYSFTYDMAALAIPFVFLVRDQRRQGFLPREKAALSVLYGGCLALLLYFGDRTDRTTFGGLPLGSFVLIGLFGLILRRRAAFPGPRGPAA